MIEDYAREINEAILSTHVGSGRVGDNLDAALRLLRLTVIDTHRRGNKTILVGNGGSAMVSSHIAIDYTKNGGWRATALNDVAALTCLANDYGYEHVFAKQIEMHARDGDVLIIISSSGKSPNMLLAADAARAQYIHNVFTFTGFDADNPLRKMGDVNFYVPSAHYGIVEISHWTLLHSIVDQQMGWLPKPTISEPEIGVEAKLVVRLKTNAKPRKVVYGVARNA